MRADSLAGQIVAVLSRRTPAFEPLAGEPMTFPGRLQVLLRRRSTSPSSDVSEPPDDRSSTTYLTDPDTVPIDDLLPGGVDAVDSVRFVLGAMLSLAETLSILDAAIRIRIRNRNFIDLLVLDLDVLAAIAAARDAIHGPRSVLDRAIAALDHARAALEREGLAGGLTITITDARAALVIATFDHASHARHARALDRAIDAIDRAHAHAGSFAALDVEAARSALASEVAITWTGTRHGDLEVDIHRIRVALDRVRDDFTEADLRWADLEGLSLEGVRWSATTRWPAGWVERVERDSVEVAPGVFEVRRGQGHDRILVSF